MSKNNLPPLMGLSEIAGYLNANPKTVAGWLRRGKIPVKPVATLEGKGQVWQTEDLLPWLDEMKAEAPRQAMTGTVKHGPFKVGERVAYRLGGDWQTGTIAQVGKKGWYVVKDKAAWEWSVRSSDIKSIEGGPEK